jgi:hypothetical protein
MHGKRPPIFEGIREISDNWTGNVRRRVRAAIVAVNSEHYKICVCICSLRYPACNAHAPYCHLWPAPLYNIFPHYLTNDTNFEKRYLT